MTRIFWSLLIAGLTFNICRAQETRKAPSQSATKSGASHSYNISLAQKERKNPIPFTEVSSERGKKAFLNRCVLCHGPNADGKGTLAAVIDVRPPDFNKPEVLSGRTDGELFVIIGTGSENMPGKKLTRLTIKQIWDVVNYLRAVEGKKPAKVANP
ncbi:MAG: c-type cytochrome [Terriglobia bacterium]